MHTRQRYTCAAIRSLFLIATSAFLINTYSSELALINQSERALHRLGEGFLWAGLPGLVSSASCSIRAPSLATTATAFADDPGVCVYCHKSSSVSADSCLRQKRCLWQLRLQGSPSSPLGSLGVSQSRPYTASTSMLQPRLRSRRPGLCSLLCLLAFLLLASGVKDNKFYKVLDVDSQADEATIKRAYKKQAMKWHPDRNPDNTEEATQRFSEVLHTMP